MRTSIVRSGSWYAAALGDATARALHPDAPRLAPEDPATWRWDTWPWSVLARLAVAAARRHAGLVPPATLALLERVERHVEQAQLFAEDASAGGELPRARRQRARWLDEAAWHAGVAIRFAARAAGPTFASRDRYDSDVPRATTLAIQHAAAADLDLELARFGVGDAVARRATWSAMARADRSRAPVLRARARAASARARLCSRPDPAAAMLARADELERRAARWLELANAIEVAPPRREVAVAATFAYARDRVVDWLRAQALL